VFGRFLPRDTSFFDFFDRHAALTLEGAKQFSTIARTGANIAAGARRIKEIEHEADVVTHRCVEALHKTFITPFERGDIYRLISRMDDVVDLVEATSERIALYELTVDRRAPQPGRRARQQLSRSAWPAGPPRQKNGAGPAGLPADQQARERLDEILRAALASSSAASRTDRDHQGKIQASSATDRCEDVANTVEGIVLENA
jgi:hypothetical protein